MAGLSVSRQQNTNRHHSSSHHNISFLLSHYAFSFSIFYPFESLPNWHLFSRLLHIYHVNMPYDPDDLYEAEPKLLSISCFPTFFSPAPAPTPTPQAPPTYEHIMAGNTRYHRVSEEPRVSMQSTTGNADLDAALLLLEPSESGSDDEDAPPKNEHKFKCHPTVLFRLIAVCVLISSFVLFVVSRRPRSVAATIFVCFALIRNILVIIHHIIKRHIRIRIEFRNRSLRSRSPRNSCPEWLKSGPLHLLLDSALVIVLLITTIIATQGSYGWRYGYDYRTQFVVPACILAYIGK